jgi:hypothetical protein
MIFAALISILVIGWDQNASDKNTITVDKIEKYAIESMVKCEEEKDKMVDHDDWFYHYLLGQQAAYWDLLMYIHPMADD